jgi:hypothetical protein
MHLGLDFHSELDQAAIETISFLVNCLQIQTSIHDDCGLAFNEPTNESPSRTWLMYVHLLKCIHIHRQTIKNCYEKRW